MTHTSRTDALHFLADRPLTPISSLVLQTVVMLVKWEERRRTRLSLAHLDAHLLKDIGLSETEAGKEIDKPFWVR